MRRINVAQVPVMTNGLRLPRLCLPFFGACIWPRWGREHFALPDFVILKRRLTLPRDFILGIS